MSITDELMACIRTANRSYEDVRNPYNDREILHIPEEELLAIADRIDEAHKHAIGHINDQDPETMAKNGWIKLPVSKDGDVLHIGELVDEMLPFGGYAAPAPIDTMELSRGASGYGWMVKLDAENGALISPKLLRHHHEPTVEDVMVEFATDWECAEDGEGKTAVLKEYAAKLRLVKEDE